MADTQKMLKVLHQYHKYLYGCVYSELRNHHDTEDVLQNLAVYILEKRVEAERPIAAGGGRRGPAPTRHWDSIM